MSRVTFRRKYLTIAADVPDRLVQPARRVRAQLRRARAAVDRAPERQLVFAPVPELNLQARDPRSQIPFLRSMSQPQFQLGEQGGSSRTDDGQANELKAAVAQLSWYHTIELPFGIVTPGFYDHRPLVSRYGLPDDLSGQRALDVATADGFWAFELERRGADVVAEDIARVSQLDLPPPLRDIVREDGLDAQRGAGFALAHGALNSKVQPVTTNVYDLNPADLGTFDLVHAGDLLLHLEDPVRALCAIRSVTRGTAMITDCFDPTVVGNGAIRYLGGWNAMQWWAPSVDTLAQMILDAGFATVKVNAVYSLRARGNRTDVWRAAIAATAPT